MPSRVQAALGSLGMDPAEARAYEHLAREGPHDAAGVAAALGATRAEAHRILSRLLSRGHVAVVATEPFTYRALGLAEHARAARVAQEDRARAVERAGAVFHATLSSGRAPRQPPEVRWRVRSIAGRHAFHAAARRLVSKARSTVLIAYAPCASAVDERARKGLLDAAARKGAEGILLRVVAPRTRASSAPAPVFFVVDGRECLFLSVHSGALAAARGGCWTSVGPLVALAEALHHEMWLANAREDAGGQAP